MRSPFFRGAFVVAIFGGGAGLAAACGSDADETPTARGDAGASGDAAVVAEDATIANDAASGHDGAGNGGDSDDASRSSDAGATSRHLDPPVFTTRGPSLAVLPELATTGAPVVDDAGNPVLLPGLDAAALVDTDAAYAPTLMTLAASAADFVVYTTDGTTPSCTNGQRYDAPFGMFRDGVVQAVACGNDGAASDVATRSTTFGTYLAGGVTGERCALSTLGDYAKNHYWVSSGDVEGGAGDAAFYDSTSTAGLPPMRCWDETALDASPANAGLEVISLANFPDPADASTYAFFPATIAFSQPITAAGIAGFMKSGPVTAGVKTFALMWGNRCHALAGNTSADCVGYDPKAVNYAFKDAHFYIFFTSVARADACTTAQTLATAGASLAAVQAPLSAAGVAYAYDETALHAAPAITTVADGQAFAGAANYTKYTATGTNAAPSATTPWLTDVCFVPESQDPAASDGGASALAAHVAGIMFDWEVADKRTAAETANLFATLAPALRKVGGTSFSLLLSADSLYGAGQYAGITAESGPTLLANLDGVEIYFEPGAYCERRALSAEESLDDQMTIWGGGTMPADTSKFILSYDVTNDENRAKEARAVLLSKHFKYVEFQSAYLRQYTCDVSDQGSATVTTIARHVRDLLDLPAPLGSP